MSKIVASTIAGLSGAAPTFTNGVNVTGVVTATTFSGNVTGNLTGTASTATAASTAYGLTGSPNITVGVVTATSFVGSGASLTGISAGKILQARSNTYNSSTQTTSGNYVVTGLSTSITPSSTSSRILVLGYFDISGNLGAAVLCLVGLYRNNTLIVDPITTTYNPQSVGFSYLDSPSTVGITTYAIYYKASPGGGNTATFNGGNSTPVASIQLLEVGP